MARANKANSIAYQPALEKITDFDINWNIVAYPSPAWARQVFPGDEEDVAVAKLADAIFAASRVDDDDPIAAWKNHNATLRSRTAWLNGQRFQRAALLRPGHRPDRRARRRPRMEGRRLDRQERHHLQPQHPDRGSVHHAACEARRAATCVSTKPLSYQGTLIDDIAVRFEEGRIVEAKAARGEEVLQQGARHRRGRAPARRSGAGAAFIADLEERTVVLQHAVRRERRLPHRARPMLFEMLRRRRQADAGARSRRRAATRA